MRMDPAENPPARLRRLPSRLLNQNAAHAHRAVARALGEFRTHHFALLAAVEERGPSSQAALGRACGMDRSDVVAAVNHLAEKGLVRREPAPHDRRSNVITLTAEGCRTLHELDERVRRTQDEIFAALSPDEREQLTDLLARVLDHHSGA
ncbi:MarR family winged helix-turn-helix transcriptional regulator [Streptomonospora litoralis]|uniref:Transcriptional regulator SlyA n=1 Tax=Streptomonospora litoralis TaxID=2498135 RepID=A0A4P6QAJ9_9ACTN|nr:MarR family winged helix-turn-helix transcriptional regulator [Streptomonospora litoralis]QBI56484.1 Transcriptional regulator SlyA [Streptomonospora litoralis]